MKWFNREAGKSLLSMGRKFLDFFNPNYAPSRVGRVDFRRGLSNEVYDWITDSSIDILMPYSFGDDVQWIYIFDRKVYFLNKEFSWCEPEINKTIDLYIPVYGDSKLIKAIEFAYENRDNTLVVSTYPSGTHRPAKRSIGSDRASELIAYNNEFLKPLGGTWTFLPTPFYSVIEIEYLIPNPDKTDPCNFFKVEGMVKEGVGKYTLSPITLPKGIPDQRTVLLDMLPEDALPQFRANKEQLIDELIALMDSSNSKESTDAVA